MVVGSLSVETDVVVLGGGPGGYVAAIRAAQLGKIVYLVEKEKKLGGICLNHGCIPTKALLHAADLFASLKEMGNFGINVKDYDLDASKMNLWKHSVVDKLSEGVAMLLKKNGVEVITGKGSFLSDSSLRVEGKSDVNLIKFKQAIIATGSSPVQVPGFQFGKNIISSKEALEIDKIPETLIIIGGGYIGTEMGTLYGKLGSKVHIIEMEDRILSSIDKEIVDVVSKRLDRFNVTLHLNTTALSFDDKDDKVAVKIKQNKIKQKIKQNNTDGGLQDADNKESREETNSEGINESSKENDNKENNKEKEEGLIEELIGDKLMVVVGRRPNSEGIGLDEIGVGVDERGFVKVDESMRTNLSNIYAIGDVVGQPMLAHKASRQGKVAAEVICGEPSAFDNKAVPFAVFNDPEISSVGLTEKDALARGYKIKTGRFPFAALGRALTLDKKEGFVKIVAEENSGVILGVHIVGPDASDMISEASLAIEMGATVEDLLMTIHPHPTLPESLMEAAEVTMGKAIHIFRGK